MLTFILFLLLLSVIIVIHELGHLIAAKMFGVYCYEFSFGMGPLLWKHQKGETQYSIRGIPIGGFVAMAGEQDGDAAYPGVVVPEGRRITEKKWWQKVIIMLAGVFNNFVLAYVIITFVVLGNGAIQLSPAPVVGSVTENSPADIAGFEADDEIIYIEKSNGESVEPETFSDIQSITLDGEATTFIVLRDGEEITLTVYPEYNEEYESYMIGITAIQGEIIEINLINCWYWGGYELKYIAGLMISAILSLFRGVGLNNLSGPVGIYQATETYASMGLASYMFLIAQLSLNVGIFNLLPLPVLDGGQVVITLVEAIAHRPLNEKVKTGIMVACWILLIGLMIFVTFKDIINLF